MLAVAARLTGMAQNDARLPGLRPADEAAGLDAASAVRREELERWLAAATRSRTNQAPRVRCADCAGFGLVAAPEVGEPRRVVQVDD